MQEEKKIQTIYIENQEETNDEINLREVLDKYRYHWKWFLLSVLGMLILSYFYLLITQSQYLVSTTIFIDDKETGGLTSELNAFEDMGVFTGNNTKKSVTNEMGILKSRTLLEKVVKKLNLTMSFYRHEGLATREIYKDDVPYKISINTADSLFYRLDTSFSVTPVSQNKFLLKFGDKDLFGEFAFGKGISTGFGDMVITPKNSEDMVPGEELDIRIAPIKRVLTNYGSRIKLDLAEKKSSLVAITLTDKIKQKAQDILDHLVIEYNKDAIDYKSMIAANTDSFINDRILDISGELTNVDLGVEEFKVKNQLTDIGYEANLVLQSDTQVDQRIVELSSQIKLVDYLLDHIKTHKDDLIPANLGLNDVSTSQNTNIYNQLLMERNRILKSSSRLNPTVVNLDAQLATLRQSVEQSLINLRSSLQFSLSDVQNQGFLLNSKRANAPKQEREFQDIKRKQQIVEALYLYLLQKREENAISLGIPVPNAKVVDKADGSDKPVSPKGILVLLGAGLAGLFIPFTVISLKSLLDNKVHTREDIEKVIKVPFLGDIPHSKKRNSIVVTEKNNNEVAEAFRLLRTNMGFMLSGDQQACKTIFITSTVAAEGKTFVAINLAASLALLNKRVLLVGADIRVPKLREYLMFKSNFGLSHYLNDNSVEVEQIIQHHEEGNIDVIDSGVIPPNPSELLLNGRFEGVLTFGQQHYDYVIIDTSPVNQVTDTLLLGHHADLFIYVVRANYLDKRMLKIPKMMLDNKRLPNMAILINDLNMQKESYGYGYGYRESKKKKVWWKFNFI